MQGPAFWHGTCMIIAASQQAETINIGYIDQGMLSGIA